MPDSVRPANLMTAVADQQGTMSPKLRAIAANVLDAPETFIQSTSREICARIGTSEPTLIRFCQTFGYTGLSEFRIDLALALAQSARTYRTLEPLANDRRQVNIRAKRAIAQAALGLIGEDRSILVDNGSTAEIFASLLGDAPPLTLMTTGLMVAQNALAHPQHTVLLTGGQLRRESLSLTGRAVEAALEGLRFDTLVMGADAVDPDQGLSTFLEDEAHLTRAMVEVAGRVIALADRTKLTKPSLHRICALDRVEILVTDLAPGDPMIELIEARGVAVVLADPDETMAEASE